jgi:hypothetical protein
VQVFQATLPFGQTATVIDPCTGCSTAPYKQILRVRLLLHPVESASVCSSRRTAGLQAVLPGIALRRYLTSFSFRSLLMCDCLPASAIQLATGYVVVINQSERCLPEYLITFS